MTPSSIEERLALLEASVATLSATVEAERVLNAMRPALRAQPDMTALVVKEPPRPYRPAQPT